VKLILLGLLYRSRGYRVIESYFCIEAGPASTEFLMLITSELYVRSNRLGCGLQRSWIISVVDDIFLSPAWLQQRYHWRPLEQKPIMKAKSLPNRARLTKWKDSESKLDIQGRRRGNFDEERG
jgi:hypothetical protein